MAKVVELPTWQSHVKRWKDCRLCHACERRDLVVLGRGKIPCDVLFVGEAPGASEDVTAQPFVGPAGHLLDYVIEQAYGPRRVCCLANREEQFRWAFTNLVGCFPTGTDGGKEEPDDESVEACKPRLQEFARLCDRPVGRLKLVVAVGTLAFGWLDPGYKHSVKFHRKLSLVPQAPEFGTIHLVQITHPGNVFKLPVAMRSLTVKRMVVTLRDALERI